MHFNNKTTTYIVIMERKDRFETSFEYLKSKGFVHTQKDLAIKMEATPSNISRAFNGDAKTLTDKFMARFNDAFNNIFNIDWLLNGEGDMLNETPSKEIGNTPEHHLIPFFDDIVAVGGDNDKRAVVDVSTSPTEMINTGDWFKSATAAIRHIGDSMREYPSGSILAIKRVNNINLLVNGKTYVIETEEYRVTKMIRDDGEYIMAYSSNQETYPDGTLIHAPMRIPKQSIRHMHIVLGCVHIEQSRLINF